MAKYEYLILDVDDTLLKHVNNPAVCLMVGDSMSTDIAGAYEAGMDTCWYNRSRKAYNHSIKPTHEISLLSDLIQLIK